MMNLVKVSDFDDRTGFRGYFNKFERPVKLPISAPILIFYKMWKENV